MTKLHNILVDLFLVLFLSSIFCFNNQKIGLAQSSGDYEIIITTETKLQDVSQGGSGLINDPYRIEFQEINGLYVENINVYVLIRNCTFSNSLYGAYFYQIGNFILENNSFIDCSQGAYFYFSLNCQIRKNNFQQCSINGLYFFVTNQNVVLEGNKFFGCGIDISGGPFTIQNCNENTVNNKPLIIYTSSSTENLNDREDIGQLILYQLNGKSLSNLKITNTTVGILVYISDQINMNNCSISDCVQGIGIYSSDNIKVNSSIIENSITGIKINYCHNVLINNSYILNINNIGIQAVQIWDTQIENNVISSFQYASGTGMQFSAIYSETIIQKNAIFVPTSIILFFVSDTIIKNNILLAQIISDSSYVNEGNQIVAIEPPQIISPANNDKINLEFTISWTLMNYANKYIITINGIDSYFIKSPINTYTLQIDNIGNYSIQIKACYNDFVVSSSNEINIQETGFNPNTNKSIASYSTESLIFIIAITISLNIFYRKKKLNY